MESLLKNRGSCARLLLPCLLLGAGACAPYALPPLRISVAGGGTLGTLTTPAEEPPEKQPRQHLEHSELGVLQFSVALTPLTLFRLGYFGDFYVTGDNHHNQLRHGLAGRVTVYPKIIRRRRLYRIGLFATGELLYDATNPSGPGGGGTFGISAEMVAGVFDGPLEGKNCLGWAFGEIGLGLFVSGSYRYLEGQEYGVMAAGLRASLPATAGICGKVSKK